MALLEPGELPHWPWGNQPEKLSWFKWVICVNPANLAYSGFLNSPMDSSFGSAVGTAASFIATAKRGGGHGTKDVWCPGVTNQ